MDLFKRNRLSADFIAVPAEPSGAELTPPTIDRSAIVAELDQLMLDCRRAGRMDLADRVIDARSRIRPVLQAEVPVIPGRPS
jgi:hypothetical protein